MQALLHSRNLICRKMKMDSYIFHIAERLFHKAFTIPNMALEVASVGIIIIWSIAKLWKKLFSKDSSSVHKK